MSDLIVPDAEPEPVGPDPAAPLPTPEPDAAATALQAEADAPEPEVFDREYVEKLRRESANYRTQLREYESIFGDMDDDSRNVFRDYFATSMAAANGDEDAARRLVDEFGVEPEEAEEDIVEAAEATGLTEDAVKAMIAEALGQRDEQAAQAQAIQTVQSRARDEFGYDPSSED